MKQKAYKRGVAVKLKPEKSRKKLRSASNRRKLQTVTTPEELHRNLFATPENQAATGGQAKQLLNLNLEERRIDWGNSGVFTDSSPNSGVSPDENFFRFSIIWETEKKFSEHFSAL